MRLSLATLLLSLTLLPACGKDDSCDVTCTTGTHQTGTGTTSATGTTGSTVTTGTPVTTTGVTGTGTGTDTAEPTGSTTHIATTDGSDSAGTTSTSTSTSDATTGISSTSDTTGDTGVVPGGACVDDGDCALHSDCCDCFAVPEGDDPPICKKGCDKTQCELLEIDEARCRFGVCVTEKLPCDPSKVACNALPPNCPMGQVASVKGLCWSGQCVPATSCDVVPGCEFCPESFLCVFKEAQIPNPPATCEPIPAQCGGKIDCGCTGQQVCVDPFSSCNKVGDNELHCACPAC